MVLFLNCVVPENIRTPTTGRYWKFWRGGGPKTQEILVRRGLGSGGGGVCGLDNRFSFQMSFDSIWIQVLI